ncbi:MAG: lipoyl(octanoyl) transferase LipB [Bdellovibrionaceae bacterium]|nr:lipoyl(octanoyl) transferase LipB [Pseudobdellovibrionaceae bacterium]
MRFEEWGEIPYEESTNKQLELVQKRIEDKIEDTWVFCSHPPLVTLGRGTNPGDLLTWQGEVYESSRGGKATYHGPSQLVIYPIVKIANRDLLKFLENLEQVTIEALKPFNIVAQKSRQAFPNTSAGSRIPTGVWVENRKIASIGIAVKKWVSYHGLALNLDLDPNAFQGIQPCGYSKEIMTSMEKELGFCVNRKKVFESFKDALNKI